MLNTLYLESRSTFHLSKSATEDKQVTPSTQYFMSPYLVSRGDRNRDTKHTALHVSPLSQSGGTEDVSVVSS